MRIAVFNSRGYDRRLLDEANARHGHELTHLEARLDATTAPLADGYEGVCAFVNDHLDAEVMAQLAASRTRLLTRGREPRARRQLLARGAARVRPAQQADRRHRHRQDRPHRRDVHEEGADLFFEDLSDTGIKDDVFARLLTVPNVLMTAHQAFFTEEALRNIAETTLANATAFAEGRRSGNELDVAAVHG